MSNQKNLNLPTFARTECDCGQCVAACRTKPGALIPSDLEKLHEKCAPEVDLLDWAEENLQASEGAKVTQITPNGNRVFHVPSLVPRQRADGSCVFLTTEGRCSVHEVSPFGCSHFNTHDVDDGARATVLTRFMVEQQIEAHTSGASYSIVIEHLVYTGRTAKPLSERNDDYRKAIESSG